MKKIISIQTERTRAHNQRMLRYAKRMKGRLSAVRAPKWRLDFISPIVKDLTNIRNHKVLRVGRGRIVIDEITDPIVEKPLTSDGMNRFISKKLSKYPYFENVHFHEVTVVFDSIRSVIEKLSMDEAVKNIEQEHRDLVWFGAFRNPEVII